MEFGGERGEIVQTENIFKQASWSLLWQELPQENIGIGDLRERIGSGAMYNPPL